jgi:hypothetical protein
MEGKPRSFKSMQLTPGPPIMLRGKLLEDVHPLPKHPRRGKPNSRLRYDQNPHHARERASDHLAPADSNIICTISLESVRARVTCAPATQSQWQSTMSILTRCLKLAIWPNRSPGAPVWQPGLRSSSTRWQCGRTVHLKMQKKTNTCLWRILHLKWSDRVTCGRWWTKNQWRESRVTCRCLAQGHNETWVLARFELMTIWLRVQHLPILSYTPQHKSTERNLI